MAVVEEMLDMLGLEQERFRVVWCSSAEADRFVAGVREMTETVRRLGPSPFAVEAEADPEPLYREREVVACQ